jgi:hypothetical protein
MNPLKTVVTSHPVLAETQAQLEGTENGEYIKAIPVLMACRKLVRCEGCEGWPITCDDEVD